MKALFLGEREKSHEDVELILEGVFGLSFDWATNLSEFLDKTVNDSFILPIIVESEFSNISKIIDRLLKLDLKATPILITNNPKYSGLSGNTDLRFVMLKTNSDVDLIEESIEKATGLLRQNVNKQYHPVHIYRFLKFNNVGADVYIKLSDEKFVKVINKDEMYDSGLIEKYTQRGVEKFYIREDDFKLFFNHFQTLLRNELYKEEISEEKLIETQLSSVSFVHEALSSFNFSPDIVELVENITHSNIRLVKKSNTKLFDMLKHIVRSKSYLYEHSLMTSYISIEIAKKMNWSNTNTLEKLSLASLLHDIYLDDKLAKVHDIEKEKLKELDWKETKRVQDHSFQIAQQIRSSEGFPPDLDNILLNHHELPDSSGYPRGLSALKISPISCIFILSEKIAHTLFFEGDSGDTVNKLNLELEKYNFGNFKKAFQGARLIWGKN